MSQEEFTVFSSLDRRDSVELGGESHVRRLVVPGACEVRGHHVVPLDVHLELVLPVVQGVRGLVIAEVPGPVESHHCVLGHLCQANSLLCAEIE